VAALPLLLGFDLLSSPNRAVKEGNARMKAGKPDEALAAYDKAVAALPADPGVHFNRGTALQALGRHGDAIPEFLRATEAKDPPLKAAAFYNLGNSFYSAQKFGEALEAYKRALVLDPANERAKWNLELAWKKKRDEEQEKQDKNDQNNPNNKDNKDSKDKNKQDDQADHADKDKQDGTSDQAKQDEKRQQDEQRQQGEKNKPDEPARQAQDKAAEDKAKDHKQDAPLPEPRQAQQNKGQDKNEDKHQEEGKKAAAAGAQDPAAATKPRDQREMEVILDSLERSPKDLERERARLRAVRRAAPTKDW
jgi:Ca-activated chloride channel family protein